MVLTVTICVSILPGGVTVEFDNDINLLAAKVNSDSLLLTISSLSGEQAVMLENVPDSIPCRFAITEGAHKAARWLAEQLEAEGIQAEVVEFEPNRSMGVVIHDGPTETRGRVTFKAESQKRTTLTISAEFADLDESMEDLITSLEERSARNIKHLIEAEV